MNVEKNIKKICIQKKTPIKESFEFLSCIFWFFTETLDISFIKNDKINNFQKRFFMKKIAKYIMAITQSEKDKQEDTKIEKTLRFKGIIYFTENNLNFNGII